MPTGGEVATRAGKPSTDIRREPVARATAELEHGVEIVAAYRTGPAAGVPYAGSRHGVGEVLALCSYIVGMELPGLRSLFTRATIRFARSAGPKEQDPTQAGALWYRARTRRFDRHFRILDTEVEIATIDARPVATALLRSYVPFGPATVDLDTLAAHLSPAASRLDGLVALVCGGSRGLGADLTAALALSGCHVYMGARGNADKVSDLSRRLAERGHHIEFVHGDAGDPTWCQQTLERIRAQHGRLDLLVLNACSAPSVLRIGPDASARHDEYVQQNLRLVQTPLAACLSTLDQSEGTVAYVSSSFVDDPPPGLSHYVALKQAAEGVVRTAQRESSRISSLIARPPRLQTSWNDTPAGVAGAIPTAQAALHIVNRVAEGLGSARAEVLSEFPTFAPVAPFAPLAPFPVRLCASCTTDPLLPGLRFWLKELGIGDELAVADYGQVLQTLLDPNSMFTERGGLNVLLLRVRDWLHDLSPAKAESIDFVRSHLQGMAHDIERAVRAHRMRAGAETLLLFCPSYGATSSAESILLRQTETELIASLEGVPGLQLARAADYHAHYLVDEDQVSDPIRETLAHIPYRDAYCNTLSTIVVRHAHRKLAPPRKVVVVDCDNTLWRGVVGEAGAEGIEIEPSHVALHGTLTRLVKSGMLVCLCSKNEEADVWRVFESRPDLALAREDIVAAMINWEPKPDNLRALAARLNLGLDSFIFIDDNPVECAEVRARSPRSSRFNGRRRLPRPSAAAAPVGIHPAKATKEDQTYSDVSRRPALSRAEPARSRPRDLPGGLLPLTQEDLCRAAQLSCAPTSSTDHPPRGSRPGAAAARPEIRTIRGQIASATRPRRPMIVSAAQRKARLFLRRRVLGRGVEHRILRPRPDGRASGRLA
jgi:HAD superfamily phosphatase (TIGR01681 family)